MSSQLWPNLLQLQLSCSNICSSSLPIFSALHVKFTFYHSKFWPSPVHEGWIKIAVLFRLVSIKLKSRNWWFAFLPFINRPVQIVIFH